VGLVGEWKLQVRGAGRIEAILVVGEQLLDDGAFSAVLAQSLPARGEALV
jgi:hypothetical protein